MKYLLSLLLSLILVFSFSQTAYSDNYDAIEAADALYELGLFKGVGIDSNNHLIYDLKRAPTRYEAVTMIVRLLGKADEAEDGKWDTPFTDVADWAKPYVGHAYANNLTDGITDNIYGGNQNITATEYLTFILRALGYKSGIDFQWNRAWELSDELGITTGNYSETNNIHFLRGDVAIVSNNAIYCEIKDKDKSLLTVIRDNQFKYSNRNSERDLETLRYNAGFSIKVASGVYWVPARSLGESNYTNNQIIEILKDTPEEKQSKIDTLYEALQLFQISKFYGSDDNIRIMEGNISWEHHKPGYDAVRTNNGCCATSTNWLNYILKDDYEEVGFIATSRRDGSGHVFNYIKEGEWYYFIDTTHYRTDFGYTAVESGQMKDYHNSDVINGNIHKVKCVKDYVNYIQVRYNEAPGLIFMYTAENCLALDSVKENGDITITYEQIEGVNVEIAFDDLNDNLKYNFVPSPKKYPDWSKIPSYAFDLFKY